jgi:hypothetical protein
MPDRYVPATQLRHDMHRAHLLRPRGITTYCWLSIAGPVKSTLTLCQACEAAARKAGIEVTP